MIRNVPVPTAASQATRSLITTAPYKPLLPQLPSQRITTEPTRHIEDYLSVPLQKTRGSSIKAFTYRFRKVHAYSITSGILKDVETSFGEDRFSRRWNERTDSLWWSAVAFKSFAAKRVVRTYATRKLRIAFVESLKKKGIASDGTRLNDLGEAKEEPVMGTVSLMPEVVILKTRMTDLVLQTDEAVERILSLQSRGDTRPKNFKPYDSSRSGGYKSGSGKDSKSNKRDSGSYRTVGAGFKISR